MSAESRERLAQLLRRPGADLAEAALLCCVEVEGDLDVDRELLRIDALADGLRTAGYPMSTRDESAAALSRYLAGDLGFTGDTETYEDPRNSLLTVVLDRRLGLPITLSILYIAIARRAGIRAFGIAAPAHFLVAVGDPNDLTYLDPFHGGAQLSSDAVVDRLRELTGGTIDIEPRMLRPAPAHVIIRRLLDNLTRHFTATGDLEDAVWTVELKRLLPQERARDDRELGELFVHLGRYREAADVLEAYVERWPKARDAEEVAQTARRARAKMN